MKKQLLIIVFAIIGLSANAQAPNWAWAKRAGGTTNDIAYSVATDAMGNVYATGFFSSPTLNVGTLNLTNANSGNNDVFIIKYNSAGAVRWAKSAGGINSSGIGYSVAADAAGNVYVTGNFLGQKIVFGTDTLTNSSSSGTADMFIVKYDSTGTVLWAKNQGGSSYDDAYSVAIDAAGNAYVAGDFESPTIVFGTTTLTNVSSSNFDAFIVKYNAAGAVVWAKSVGGSGGETGESITVDAAGDVYVTGLFGSTTLVIGTNTLTNRGNSDIFLIKYNASGAVLWAKSAGGNNDDRGFSVAADAAGNAYVTGYFTSPTMVIGTTTLTNADNTGNSSDMYLIKYSTTGGVLWAVRAGGNFIDKGLSVATDASGNVYVTGAFWSPTIVFDTTTFTNGGNTNMYLTKYDATGTVVWAKGLVGGGDTRGWGVATDAANNIFVTGSFNNTSLIVGSTTLSNAGGYEVYLAKIGTVTTVGINEITQDENEINIYPNPFTSQTTISFSETQKNTTIKIMDVVGKEIKTVLFSGKSLILEKGEMQSGIYFVQITDENKNVINKKIIIQ